MGKKINYSSQKPLVSIIVLSAGDVSITKECLEEIEKNTKYFEYEVYLVFNGSISRDKTFSREISKKYEPESLTIIHNKKNLGYAKANNQAAKKAGGELLVFLNNDVLVSPGWLQTLVAFMLDRKQAACSQPKLKSQVDRDYFDYTGGSGGFIDVFGYPFTRGRIFDRIERDIGQYDEVSEIAWAAGSCFLITAQVFEQMGGFDEYFFSYMEEIDLCMRLKRKGYKIYCCPKSVVFHYGAYTSNRNLPRKIFFNHRNNLYFVFKHYSIWPYFPMLLVRMAFDAASVVYYVFSGRPEFVTAVVKAYLALAGDSFKLVRKGVFSWKGRRLPWDATFYKGSAVVSHFLLGRQNFDELMAADGRKKRSYKRYVDVTYFDGG